MTIKALKPGDHVYFNTTIDGRSAISSGIVKRVILFRDNHELKVEMADGKFVPGHDISEDPLMLIGASPKKAAVAKNGEETEDEGF
ncbi:MAG: hypothetical protein SVK08_00325 [Halobacteriota archaeon]|nr:hypothetical protein [Halobacteriota archaeon]